MKTYIGSKILQAERMTLGAYNVKRGWTIPANENPAAHGYFLRYPDGYVSWTPEAIFEEAYREVNAGEISMVGQPKLPLDFRERLLKERSQLSEKTEALEKFVEVSPVFRTLDDQQQSLMMRQHYFMCEYLGTLDARLALLGSEPAAAEFDPLPDDEAGTIVEVKETRTIDDADPLSFE